MLNNMEKKRVVFSRTLRIWGDIISRYYANDSTNYEYGLELIKRSYLLLGDNGLELLTPTFAEECRDIRHKVFGDYPSYDASRYTFYPNVVSVIFSGSTYDIEQAIIDGTEIDNNDIHTINSNWMPIKAPENDFEYPDDINDDDDEELYNLELQFYSSDKCLNIDLDKDAYAINFDANDKKNKESISLIHRVLNGDGELTSVRDAFAIDFFAMRLQYLLEREEIFNTKYPLLDVALLYTQCIEILMNQNLINLKRNKDIVKSPIYNKFFGTDTDITKNKRQSGFCI